MNRENDTPLSRWSRRKRAVAAEAAEARANPAETDPQAGEAALSEPELLQSLGLPDPDTLTDGDDFAAFMKDGVPDFLRRRALRTLWRSNPALANLDGLLDYGEDFTDAAMVPEVLATAYKVGRGILTENPAPKSDLPGDAEPEMVEAASARNVRIPEGDPSPEPEIQHDPLPEPEPGLEAAEMPRPRRMAFRTDHSSAPIQPPSPNESLPDA